LRVGKDFLTVAKDVEDLFDQDDLGAEDLFLFGSIVDSHPEFKLNWRQIRASLSLG